MEFAPVPSTDERSESGSGILDEVDEIDLASRLLEAQNEAHLGTVIEDAIRSAATALGANLNPAAMKEIASVHKTAIRQLLPSAKANGNFPRHDSIGAHLGQSLSSSAEQVLGLELEGLSHEDREFEAVKQFLRFLGETVKNVTEDADARNTPDRVLRAAKEAAALYAPGLFADSFSSGNRSGRWIACENRIILLGV